MKKLLSLVLVGLVIVLTFAGCSAPEKELTQTAEFDDCIMEILDATKVTDDTGANYAQVKTKYTNNSETPLYAYCSFKVTAFQNNQALEDCSDVNGEQSDLIKEIKGGESLNVTYLFKLTDESKIEVFVCSPTADEQQLAKAVFE